MAVSGESVHPADGGCWAEALGKTTIFGKNEWTHRLDVATEEWKSNYESSLRCLDQIQYLFDQKNEQGDFTILRQDYWLDVLLEVEMELYFCDGPMLRSYISKDRAVPARWYSVRTSLSELLKSTDQSEEDLVEIEPRWTE